MPPADSPINDSQLNQPWVLVSGGFHNAGGMDKANAALAGFLAQHGAEVHLVAYSVAPELLRLPNIIVHMVSKPANSFFLSELLLERKGREVAGHLRHEYPALRVVTNGGCCAWPDINWVHCVHHAWRVCDLGAPWWFKAKNRATKVLARRRELEALRMARLVIANSARTKTDLVNILGLTPDKVRVVYLGTDPNLRPSGPDERARARAWLNKDPFRPVVSFVGAMSHDNNKGFDILWSAWQRLCGCRSWDGDLIVAGGGNAVQLWRRRAAEAGLSERITFLGHTDRVAELLAASDLLVSPVRYEAFGLNVQEAICRGVPALVSAHTGVAERYSPELKDLLLDDPENIDDLVRKLISWRAHLSYWKERVVPLARELSSYTWEDMARKIVGLAGAPQISDANVSDFAFGRSDSATATTHESRNGR